MIPYGRHTVEEDDLRAVSEALRSDWITQGPRVERFERALAERCGVDYGVVFCNGTAALQAAYAVVGLGPGDEFITSSLTFAATANAGLMLGAHPIFADVDLATGNMESGDIMRRVSSRTKAIVSVDFAGNPVEYDQIRSLAQQRGFAFISDACHSLGATYRGRAVGSLADMTVFSFHPVKSITTGEGGAVLTSSKEFYKALVQFRQHGIVKTGILNSPGAWYYEMQGLGINGRMTDFQCALGLSQLGKLDRFIQRRRAIAERYARLLKGIPDLLLPEETPGAQSAWHLYPVRVPQRDLVFRRLHEQGIGTQVHYIPVYEHPYYRTGDYGDTRCPNAEAYSHSEISLPIFPLLADAEQDSVAQALKSILKELHASPVVS